jgi:hypothetical protein
MLRILANRATKNYYIFSQEFQAKTSDLHAGLSLKMAAEKRTLIEKLNKGSVRHRVEHQGRVSVLTPWDYCANRCADNSSIIHVAVKPETRTELENRDNVRIADKPGSARCVA